MATLSSIQRGKKNFSVHSEDHVLLGWVNHEEFGKSGVQKYLPIYKQKREYHPKHAEFQIECACGKKALHSVCYFVDGLRSSLR